MEGLTVFTKFKQIPDIIGKDIFLLKEEYEALSKKEKNNLKVICKQQKLYVIDLALLKIHEFFQGNKIMELIAGLANGFIELFKAGAATFMSWVVNIIPLVVVLMTAVSACIKLIGEEKVYNVAGVLTKSIFTRYTLLPVISVLFLANPMCYTFGRFVEENINQVFMIQQ